VRRWNNLYYCKNYVVDGQRCVALNSSMMTCTMPEVRLPTDFLVNNSDTVVSAGGGVPSQSVGPHDRDQANVYVGLVFDGFRRYHNLMTAMPNITFQFYQPPTIDKLAGVIIYQPHHYADINIKVRQSSFSLMIK